MFELIYRYDPANVVAAPSPQDPGTARRLLEEGNDSFASLAGERTGSRVIPIDLEDIGLGKPGSAPRQRPMAAVLACSDARVPTELVFTRSCNELFVVRVAGNILGQEQLGSIDYAVDHFGTDLKLLVVLGHSGCGAVTAAVDAFLTPMEYLALSTSHHIRAIVNALFPAVRGAVRALAVRWGEDVSTRPGYRSAVIESAVVLNAAIMASILQENFGREEGTRRVVFGVYDLASRRVQVPGTPGERVLGLREAAPAGDPFRQLASEIVGSGYIKELLGL